MEGLRVRSDDERIKKEREIGGERGVIE